MKMLFTLLFLVFTCTFADAGWRSRSSCSSGTCSASASGQYVSCSTCPSGVAFAPGTVQMSTYKTVNGVTYKCDGNACEVVTATKTTYPSLTEGEKVNYRAGIVPAGTGTITQALPLNSGQGKVYLVKCDKTGKTLPVAFADGDLWTH